ncbi:MAG: TRAP transporter permease [Parvibaculum sp.]
MSRGIDAAEELIAAETGARQPFGVAGRLIAAVAVLWSLFQLWYASPLPFVFARIVPVLNDTEARSIHLAFAVFLAFTAFPAFRSSPRHYVPVTDWLFAGAAAVAAAYLFLFNADLATRPGLPLDRDLMAAGFGLVLLLEATRRALGLPLVILASIFLAYVFFGHLAPDIIVWKGASFSRGMDHMWLATEGVFGIAIGVSTSFVFLFVLFGALLDRAGAGHYFIQVSFALLGHLKGGPAKAAVLASGMTGLVSGSSIANTVTTGTFTIPLMKRVGFSPEKAGAVEVAASVNGQIMPPVMGAAAFLMVEYVGISYLEVIRHAFLPAIISYIALIYIVHLEALKAGMEGLPRSVTSSFALRAGRTVVTIAGFLIIAGGWYYLIPQVQGAFGDSAQYLLALCFGGLYLAFLLFASRFPDLPPEDATAPVVSAPALAEIGRTGLHFILPIGVLVWSLMVERLSPGLSAFWATVAISFILLTQKAALSLFRGDGGLVSHLVTGGRELVAGFELGARNMIGIAVATATAGIIVGAVSLTGVGQVLTELVELLSGGNVIIMLLLVALLSLVLGMGLPTTANYIVVSALMTGVIVELGAQAGFVFPLIAVHLFVFYFGIMADVTPPVGLASFAAAAISRGDPIKTGVTAFLYSLRTAVLPFLFLFNTKLLLIGIEGPVDLALTVIGAVFAVLVFASATQGFLLVRNRLWETAILLLVAFTLFRPQYWVNLAQPPFISVPFEAAAPMLDNVPDGASAHFVVTGETLDGNVVTRTVLLPLGARRAHRERLEGAGIVLVQEKDKTIVDDVVFGSAAFEAGIDFDWEIVSVEIAQDQVNGYLMYLPAGLLLGAVVTGQRRRRRISHLE